MFKERREHLYHMKNKYLTKCLCITMISAMVLSSPVSAAAEGEAAFSSEGLFDDQPGTVIPTQTVTPQPDAGIIAPPGNISAGEDISPTPGETVTPSPSETVTPVPGEDVTPAPDISVTPTPEETPTPQPSVSPTPGEDITPEPSPSVTPTPGEDPFGPEPSVSPTPDLSITPTPEDLIPLKVKKLIDKIEEVSKKPMSLDLKAEIEDLRTTYDKFTSEERIMVGNYQKLVDMETELIKLTAQTTPSDGDPSLIGDGTGNTAAALIGTPVYFTNMVSNLHAGKDFYLDSLKNNYQLSFSDDFSSVMEQIEKEYKKKQKLTDVSDLTGGGMTTSADSLLVRNWQDIIAVYIYEKTQAGEKSFHLDASCKDRLAEIFQEMNPVIRDKKDITKVTYGNRHINYYIKKNKVPKKKRAILHKYVETDCKLLCAVVTAAKGFVRESVGDDVSEERVNVISNAYSLVGKVGYFWGGKSTMIGEDPSWGTIEKVTAEGSKSTGTIRAYGLDCSGFVQWSVVNGYQSRDMASAVGTGTTDQWWNANVISEAAAQPGDLVFQRGPEAGSDNHVGIICGKTDAGDWLAVHCSSSKNGVTVGEAYGAGFRYIRQPSFYPDAGEVAQMESAGFASSTSDVTSTVTVSTTLQDVLNANEKLFGSDEREASILPMKPAGTVNDDVEIFTSSVPEREPCIFPMKPQNLPGNDVEVFGDNKK